MAFDSTTTSAAVSVSDTSVLLASLTGLVAKDLIKIDGEMMQIQSVPSAATIPVPLLGRGLDGTVQSAHVSGARVTAGATQTATGGDWTQPAPWTSTGFAGARMRTVASYSTTSTMTLPAPGSDLFVLLNGTAAITLTVPVPTKDLDGSMLWIAGDGVAAHVITFTGGLSGAGSSYDVMTVNATAPVLLGPYAACNGLWLAAVAIPAAGTIPNILATLT